MRSREIGPKEVYRKPRAETRVYQGSTKRLWRTKMRRRVAETQLSLRLGLTG